MSSQPRVAVIIPCFNAADTVAATINSVRAQTVADWELVVVDDGSTDGSVEVVAAIAADDSRISLIRQENGGVSVARNAGIARSAAPLIGLIDSDDFWKPYFLERMMLEFDNNSNLGLVFCRAEILDEDGNPTGAVTSFCDTATTVEDLLLTNPAGTCSTLMVRREVFEEVGMFSTELRRVEDQHFMIKARLVGWPMRGIGEVLVGYRTSSEGLSANLEGMLEGWEAMIELLGDSVSAEHVRNARAEHYLYLARRAVRLGQPRSVSAGYLRDAVAANPMVPLKRVTRLPGALLRRVRPEVEGPSWEDAA